MSAGILRVGGFFTGIGAHHSAMARLGVPYTMIFQCDTDAKAVKAYNMIHGETLNLGDIQRIQNLDDDLAVDLLFTSPPCQDISCANGKAAGNSAESGTRSALVWEIVRILRNTSPGSRPRYMIMEEVPTMATKYAETLKEIIKELAALGYHSRHYILNSADYGIAQSRRRFYMVSVLDTIPPAPPQKITLDKTMWDYLENDEAIDNKYYLSEDRIKGLIHSTEYEKSKGNGFAFNPHYRGDGRDTAQTITARAGSRKIDNYIITRPICAGRLTTVKGYDIIKRVYSVGGASPTITPATGGGHIVKIMCDSNTGVRRLTPRECGRLMGFEDPEIDAIAGAYADTDLYRFFGNSVCVCVFVAILRDLLFIHQRPIDQWGACSMVDSKQEIGYMCERCGAPYC